MGESIIIQQIATLTIPNGQQASNAITADQLVPYSAISIFAPGTLTGTVTLQAANFDGPGNSFETVQSPPGTDVQINAGKVTVLTALPFAQIQLFSSLAEGGARVFPVWGQRQAIVNR